MSTWLWSVDCGDLAMVQLSQSSPGNIGGSYFGQNMGGRNVLATSVLLNYPKVCPLIKKNHEIHILGDEVAISQL